MRSAVGGVTAPGGPAGGAPPVFRAGPVVRWALRELWASGRPVAGALAVVQCVAVVPFLALTWLALGTDLADRDGWERLLLGVVGFTVLVATAGDSALRTALIEHRRAGRPVGGRSLTGLTLRRWPVALGRLTLYAGLVGATGGAPVWLMVGVIWWVEQGIAPVIRVREGLGTGDSWKRSQDLLRGRWWCAARAFALPLVILRGAACLLLVAAVIRLGSVEGVGWDALAPVAVMVAAAMWLWGLVAPLLALVAERLYEDRTAWERARRGW
ncbi:hypothetical protein ACN20G_12610 [Streptomyces sp. BI20]|uniref:hypothetical protein n=1 Tax=Streptomyces sp. BI20 TaxID=3403460 RepID=UPI003C7233A6